MFTIKFKTPALFVNQVAMTLCHALQYLTPEEAHARIADGEIFATTLAEANELTLLLIGAGAVVEYVD